MKQQHKVIEVDGSLYTAKSIRQPIRLTSSQAEQFDAVNAAIDKLAGEHTDTDVRRVVRLSKALRKSLAS